jgi:hypothetical protein
MKTGSRTMLQRAPMITVRILTVAKPWVVTNRFMPRAIITNREPLE